MLLGISQGKSTAQWGLTAIKIFVQFQDATDRFLNGIGNINLAPNEALALFQRERKRKM